jgi:hypothetical protein
MSFYTSRENTPWHSILDRNPRVFKSIHSHTSDITYKCDNNSSIRRVNVCILDYLLEKRYFPRKSERETFFPFNFTYLCLLASTSYTARLTRVHPSLIWTYDFSHLVAGIYSFNYRDKTKKLYLQITYQNSLDRE